MVDRPGVRWSNLFDDLESQLEQEIDAEDIDLRVEEERLRLGRLTLRDRLLAFRGADPVVVLHGDGSRSTVSVVSVGKDWIAGDLASTTSRRSQCIVPLSAVAGLQLTAAQSALSLRTSDDETALSARLGLAFVLRDLCRRRRPVDLILGFGELHGTIDRVGRDHVDLAIHERDSARRQSAVTGVRIVPFAELRVVRL